MTGLQSRDVVIVTGKGKGGKGVSAGLRRAAGLAARGAHEDASRGVWSRGHSTASQTHFSLSEAGDVTGRAPVRPQVSRGHFQPAGVSTFLSREPSSGRNCDDACWAL